MIRPEERDGKAEKVWDQCYGKYLKAARHEIPAEVAQRMMEEGK
jgi:hypothetical protein